MEAKEEKMYKTLDLIQINLNNILISDKISTNSNLCCSCKFYFNMVLYKYVLLETQFKMLF